MAHSDDVEQPVHIDDDWNQRVIAEFRANVGRVGGRYEGLPMVLLHHKGRNSGVVRVNPLVCRPLEGTGWAIFASKGGAPSHPQWYLNLLAEPRAAIEVADGTFDVVARPAAGDEREQIWSAEKHEVPRFADYDAKAAGRTIPVVILEPVR
jgi:deazaflavin-dependent oxidoreductase (nitroreductase family)